jgi:two-component system cell cycle response regulator DivK
LRGHELFGCDRKRFGGPHEIGFVIGEKIERGTQHRNVIKPCPQRVGIETGKIEIAFRALAILQDPPERCQSKRLCAAGGFGRPGNPGRNGGIGDCDGFFALLGCQGNLRGAPMAQRIMVVEDNDLNRKLFCDVLKANGFEVEPVADGNKVLATARSSSPDLIIMDIQLPGISGVDLITAAKKDRALRAIPVLAVTAFAGKGDEERIREAGAAGYLSKPVSIIPFMNAVKGLLPS